MADRYMKLVLTVIAVALVALVAQNAIGPAIGQGRDCGQNRVFACHVIIEEGAVSILGLVHVDR